MISSSVHAWLCWQFVSPDHQMPAEALICLSDTERQRFLSLASGRAEFACSKLMIRTMLERQFGLPAACWAFQTDHYGRPHVKNAMEQSIYFNVSHTRGLVACVLSSHEQLGIDCVNLARAMPATAFIQQFMTARETAQWPTQNDIECQKRFHRLWSLKEAHLKALGRGFASMPAEIDLTCVTVHNWSELDTKQMAVVCSASASWQYQQFDVGNEHVLALAKHDVDATNTVVLVERWPDAVCAQTAPSTTTVAPFI